VRGAEARKVLVIKTGALGDVVLAMTPLKRIREAHPDAEITVLTTKPFAALFAASPWVDRIDDDGRPKSLAGQLALVRRIRRARYDRIYDLQYNDRTAFLHLMLWPNRPDWNGIAPGARLPHRNPNWRSLHALERHVEQLAHAGIWPDAPTGPGSAPAPDLSFLIDSPRPDLTPEHFGLVRPYALLVPGGSAHRPGKRWPVEHYAAAADWLRGQGLDVAVIGGPIETPLAAQIPAAKDLTGRTDFAQIAALGARAAVALGNDTGPTHLIAAGGAPTLALFSNDSDPVKSAPRGRRVDVLRRDPLAELSVDTVVSALRTLIDRA
jgi:ADP-heptose:LPS heptosyltransferase